MMCTGVVCATHSRLDDDLLSSPFPFPSVEYNNPASKPDRTSARLCINRR